MIADIATIVWKEFQEMFQKRQGMFGHGGWISIALATVVIGILLPMEAGEAWVSSPNYLAYLILVPCLMASTVVGDTFAGERERHTLETLLASRLSDQSILFGKIVGVLMYGLSLAIVGMVASLITVNVAAGAGQLLMFSPGTALAILSSAFLFDLLFSALGVVISLRASTVRQAQQTLGLISLIPLLPVALLEVIPEGDLTKCKIFVHQFNSIVLVLAGMGILACLDLILIALAMQRFQRAKLILD